MERQNEGIEINLLELLLLFKQKLVLIILVPVALAVVAFLVSSFVMEPQYEATTSIYVLNRSSETNVAYSDFQISSQLLNDYKVLVTGRNVTKEVIENLSLNMEPEELKERITVKAPDNTRVLEICVEHPSAALAAYIANDVRVVASAQLKEIMDVDAVNLVYEAEIPDEPSSPNVFMNTAIMLFLGLVGILCVLTIVYVVDDTLRTEEDVEHYLGLSTVGVIPVSKDFDIAAVRARTGTAAAESPVKRSVSQSGRSSRSSTRSSSGAGHRAKSSSSAAKK